MTTSRRILIALALATCVAAATAALALGGGTAGPPKRALVTSHGLRAGTVVGSYCSVGSGAGGCGDKEYPLHPKAVLPITPKSTIRVNFRKRTAKMIADLIVVHGFKFDVVGPKLGAKPVRGSHRRRWRLHLPRDLRDADAVGMFVDFADGGDADFWAGVKPVERWP
jgi:hypothetical protein